VSPPPSIKLRRIIGTPYHAAAINNEVAQPGELHYGPEVQLTGTINQEKFPGPPNYESIAKGDAPEDYWNHKTRLLIDVREMEPDGNEQPKPITSAEL
jgi:hypothetical protein